jgi:glycosyltransferase involved in cell wall biosynthesis
MRVLYTVPSWPRSRSANGITTYVSELRPELERLGARVEILARSVGPADIGDGVHAIAEEQLSVIDRALWRIAPSRMHLRRMSRTLHHAVRGVMARRDIDLVEVDEAFGAGIDLARSRRVPVVVRLHGPWFLVGAGTDSVRIEREGQLLRSASAITAPSRFVLERTIEKYGLSDVPAVVTPNPAPHVAERLLWNAGQHDPMHVVFAGRLDSLKGADVCLEGFLLAKQVEPNLRLTMAGPDQVVQTAEGPMPFTSFARQRLSPSDLESVRFTGMLDAEALCELRQTAVCTLVCSRFENFSYAVLEALAQGCPTIASRVGGLPEIVRQGENGLLFKSESAPALAECILALVRDRSLAARLGAQGRRDTASLFNPATIAANTLSLYERVLSRQVERPDSKRPEA